MSEGCHVIGIKRKSDIGLSGRWDKICEKQTSRGNHSQLVPRLVYEIGEHAKKSTDIPCKTFSTRRSITDEKGHTHQPCSGPTPQGNRIHDDKLELPIKGEPSNIIKGLSKVNKNPGCSRRQQIRE